MNNRIETEALIFSRYLGGKAGSPELINQYAKGLQYLTLKLSPKEEQILSTLLQSPILLAFADAGLALLAPSNGIRKRLLLMSALLETDKHYTHLFISETDTSFALLRFLAHGTAAGIKAVIGVIIILTLGWK